MIRRSIGGVLMGCVGATFGTVVHAQELEEVVVRTTPLNETHQVNVGAFGERDIMDIPLSIQNYTASDIEASAARTLLDILDNDPSVQAASVGGGYDNLRLRGFAIDWTNTLRRDGLSLAPYQDVAHENVERIDVLKGPSGFLYGFNSPGGTINYVVKRPTRESYTSVKTELTSFDGRYVATDLSRSSSTGRFGARLNGAYEKVGDFDHNGDLERGFVSLATDFRITGKVVLQVSADMQKKSAIADPLLRADQSSRADPTDPSTFIEPPEVDRRDLLTPSWGRYKSDAVNVDAKLNVELSDDWFAVVQANRSRNVRDAVFQDLFDIQPDGAVGFGAIFYSPDERLTVQALQGYVGGKFKTGFLGHDIFAGVSAKRFRDRVLSGVYPEVSVGNVLDPVNPPPVVYDETPLQQTDHVKESSVFFSDLLTLTERWQLLSGVRYISYVSRAVDPDGIEFKQHTENTLVPSFGLIFKPRQNMTTYASHSRGLQEGEFAPFFADNAGEQSRPIRSKQYELGAKLDLGGRMDFGLALFDVERDAGYVNLDNDFVIDGRQRHRGAELVASGTPTASLSFSASLAYLDTRLLDVTELSILDKRTEGTPKTQAGLSFDYRVPALRGLVIGAAVTYASERPVDPQNSGFADGYTVVDASLRYATKFGSHPVTARLNIKNLFDEYYYSSAFFQGGLSTGRPRELILALSMDL